MCSGSNGGTDDMNTIERESEVDTFHTTEQKGPVSEAGHSGLSTSEALDIAFNPASKLSSPGEKTAAAAQAALPGGFVIGGLRALGLRSHGSIFSSRSPGTLLTGSRNDEKLGS